MAKKKSVAFGGAEAPKKVEVEKKAPEAPKPAVTYIGQGAVSGEYLFEEIAGSVSANSVEEATAKAEELLRKHPALRS